MLSLVEDPSGQFGQLWAVWAVVNHGLNGVSGSNVSRSFLCCCYSSNIEAWVSVRLCLVYSAPDSDTLQGSKKSPQELHRLHLIQRNVLFVGPSHAALANFKHKFHRRILRHKSYSHTDVSCSGLFSKWLQHAHDNSPFPPAQAQGTVWWPYFVSLPPFVRQTLLRLIVHNHMGGASLALLMHHFNLWDT